MCCECSLAKIHQRNVGKPTEKMSKIPGKLLVRCKKCNNLAISCLIHHVRPAFDAPFFVDSIQAYYHNMTSINEDTTSIVGITRETFHHIILQI
jgi:hypothetical protein